MAMTMGASAQWGSSLPGVAFIPPAKVQTSLSSLSFSCSNRIGFGHPFQSLKCNTGWSDSACRSLRCHALADNNNIPSTAATGEEQHQGFVEEGRPSFWERLQRAWRVLFPPKRMPSSNAQIAKQRLKMILISDRCAVSDEAKRKIVANIVGALSDFVEIESEEKVQLNVTTDPDLGTVYSVTVPVRRVKPEYQDFSREVQSVELGEGLLGGTKTWDVRFEFPDSKT